MAFYSFIGGLVVGMAIFFIIAGITAFKVHKEVLKKKSEEHKEIIDEIGLDNEQTEEKKKD